MDASFWHERWDTNRIGFHQEKPNPLLVTHLNDLGLAAGDRIFVPLCGKTLDIPWLLAQGHRVVGAELSSVAVEQLFAEMQVEPETTEHGALKRYRADGVDIFAGDIFDLDADLLGPVQAVFDRAALVALPTEMRARYASHLASITHTAPQLLITFEYDQDVMAGPPFSVVSSEVLGHYAEAFSIDRLTAVEVAGGLKGICPATEVMWRLQPKGRV